MNSRAVSEQKEQSAGFGQGCLHVVDLCAERRTLQTSDLTLCIQAC